MALAVHRCRSKGIVVLIFLLAFAGAQETISGSIPGASIVDRNRADRSEGRLTKPVAPNISAVRTVTTDGATVAIAGIRFEGAKAPARVAEAAKRFLGQTASRETLQRLAAALSQSYGESNVALYTVTVPVQDFANGVVVIGLTEGRIAQARITGPEKSHRLLRARLARLLVEAPLSRKTFERQMTLIGAIPGLTIDTDLKDPDATGALALTVTPRQKSRKISFGFSNRGVDQLGSGQFDAKADFYGFARDGDKLSLAASTSSDLRRYRYGSVSYGVQLTASGLSLTASGAYLGTRPKGSNATGRAKLAGVTLAYPLIRDFHHAADVTIGIDGLNSDAALFGNLLATERTRALRAAASWSETREKRAVAVAGSVSQGLAIVGERVGPFTKADFRKGTLTLNAAQQIGRFLFLRGSASGQYSRDALPAAERFSIGGEATGRAFDSAILTGDKGAGGLVELAYRPVAAGKMAQSEVYSFVDGGVVGIRPRGILPGADYSLASVGFGVRARFKEKAELGLEVARAIDKPYPAYQSHLRVSVEWRLTL